MKKHVIAAVAATTFVTTAMAGCTSADTTAGGESAVTVNRPYVQTEAVMDSTELSGDAAEDDGKVTLTVWAEEANFDVLQEMIDSF